MVETEMFRAAMGKMVNSVAAVATMQDSIPFGIIATAVASLSDNPPSLLVCVNKSSSIYQPITTTKKFSVNFLSTAQEDIVTQFGAKEGAARFHPDKWASSRGGQPMLKGAVVSFDCELASEFEGHTHAIFSSLIKRITMSEETDAQCLLWTSRQFARHHVL